MIDEKPLVVTLFGSMRIEVCGQPMPRLRTRKGYWLFGLLVLNQGREVRREWLAQLLWPDSQESQARANLNLSVTDLRKALGREAFRLQSVTTSTLRLDLTEAECDLIVFDTFAVSQKCADLERAVACYAGPLLADCCEPWATHEREQREQTYLQTMEKLAKESSVREDWRQTVHFLRLIVQRDPYRDSTQMQLMNALVHGGDPHAALQVYRQFVRFLRQNDPLARPPQELEQRYQQIRSQARWEGDSRVSPPQARPPLRPVNSVPTRITPLVGRGVEINQVAAMLRRSRLVTLTGVGGVGKTSLAIVVASEMENEYLQGATFVSLERLTDPRAIPLEILAALGVPPGTRQKSIPTLTQALAAKTMLLVLDNLEHLLPAGAILAQEILQRCPGITLLVTSRRPLGLPDEVVWRMLALSVPDPHGLPCENLALLEVAQRSDAIRLFTERACAKRRDFEITSQNVRTVLEICRRLDGIPFAIELAASQVVILPIPEIARRLQDDHCLLTGSNPTARPRHRTLAALMDWSFHLLNETEQKCLLHLSVFTDGFTLEAAEAVCSDGGLRQSQILELLTSLVNHSLVVYQEAKGLAQYRLLEIVKQYAAGLRRASRMSAANCIPDLISIAESCDEEAETTVKLEVKEAMVRHR